MPQPRSQSSEYRIRDWVVSTTKSTIPSMQQTDAFSAELGIPIPEMTFLESEVAVEDARSGFKLSFNTRDALRGVSKENELRVSYAEHWASRRQPHESSTIQPSQPWDWTYSTAFSGRSSSTRDTDAQALAHSWTPVDTADEIIPLDKLSDTSHPILFYDDVQLYDDELGDNGQVGLNVKIRVMPFAWFILQRLFLRVDKVLFRMYDVRVYCDLEEGVVRRECTGWESGWDALKRCLPPSADNIIHDDTIIQATLRTMDKYGAKENCTQWKGLGCVKEVCRLR